MQPVHIRIQKGLAFSWLLTVALTDLSSFQELGCSYTDVAAQDGEAILRAILASPQSDRCKRAQAFISTQGLEPERVADLVAEEVTRELLSPSEGAGTLPSGFLSLSDNLHKYLVLRIWM